MKFRNDSDKFWRHADSRYRKCHILKMSVTRILCFVLLMQSNVGYAQTGLQGFDRNYPDTPAGDEPRGFTPEVAPVASPNSPPTMSHGLLKSADDAQDPYTEPDPMIGGETTEDEADTANLVSLRDDSMPD